MMNTLSILGNIAEVVHPAEGSFTLNGSDNIVDAVINIITRHSMQQDELEKTLKRWSPTQVTETLELLRSSGKAQIVKRYGKHFCLADLAHFP